MTLPPLTTKLAMWLIGLVAGICVLTTVYERGEAHSIAAAAKVTLHAEQARNDSLVKVADSLRTAMTKQRVAYQADSAAARTTVDSARQAVAHWRSVATVQRDGTVYVPVESADTVIEQIIVHDSTALHSCSVLVSICEQRADSLAKLHVSDVRVLADTVAVLTAGKPSFGGQVLRHARDMALGALLALLLRH